MDKTKIFLENGVEQEVNCLFYLYNSKYYFLYTLNEVDENNYVRLYLVKVGKESTNTENGPIETGNMIGIEIPTDDEWKEVQGSVSKIVSSKKTKTEDKDIKYLPMSMLKNLKIVGKKSFRLLSNIIEKDFGVVLKEKLEEKPKEEILNDPNLNKPIEEETTETILETSENEELDNSDTENKMEQSEIPIEIEDLDQDITIENNVGLEKEIENVEDKENEEIDESVDPDIIIDYRTRFFEEQEKNKHLKEEIELLKAKLEDIDKIIKEN